MASPRIFPISGISQSGSAYAEKWGVTNVYNSAAARAYVMGAAPHLRAIDTGIVYRQDILVDEQGAGLWHGTVSYAGGQEGQTNSQTGSWTFDFSATGGQFQITHSKQTVARYPSSAVDFKQAIDVQKDGADLTVNGTTIVIPALQLNYSVRHPLGTVNEAYARNLASLVGRVNSTPFRGFAAGEVLMIGASGGDGSQSEAVISVSFACEANLQSLMIGAISGIQKDGHDLLWVHWKDAVASGKPTKEPLGVYVERIYERVNLSAALGM